MGNERNMVSKALRLLIIIYFEAKTLPTLLDKIPSFW